MGPALIRGISRFDKGQSQSETFNPTRQVDAKTSLPNESDSGEPCMLHPNSNTNHTEWVISIVDHGST